MRRSLQLSLFALVLVGLVGGSLAFFLAQKSVTVTVDGQARHVGTYADTVGEVLDEQGLLPASHDVVLPAVGQTLTDGATVVLNRARPLQLTVDGVQREVYVTALSVDQALDQLGYRADDLVLSASRSERLPLDGMAADHQPAQGRRPRQRRQGAHRHDDRGHGRRAARRAGHRAVSATDRTSLRLDQTLLDKMRLQVFRVTGQGGRVTSAIAPERVETAGPQRLPGRRDRDRRPACRASRSPGTA